MAHASESPIARALVSDDVEDRRQATAELARLPLEDALPLLLVSLGDDDWRVRKEATFVARTFGGARPLVAALVGVFAGGENVGLRNAAVDVLSDAGHAATIALSEALPRLDADGRKLAVETLGRGRDPAALQALEGALGDGDPNVRQAAIEAIAAIGANARERVQEILLARLDDRDRLARLTALEGLRALDVAVPWERLEPLLEDSTLRTAALSAAALASSPDAARTLVWALSSARGNVFDHALRALGRLAEGPLGASVIEALRAAGPELGQRLVTAAMADGGGDDATARRATALVLAAMARADGVVDVAVDALAEDALAEPAQRALAVLGGGALPALFEKIADTSAPPDARAALVEVIAEIVEGPASDTAAALVSLRGAARDPERLVAVRALRALSHVGDESDLELVAERTLAEARPVAAAAEGALAALAARFPTAARKLADRVGRDEAYLLAALIVIGALGAASAFQERDAIFLAHAATAGDTRARRAAVEAVSEIRATVGAAYPGAMEVLSFALTDEEQDVQAAAARALGRLCSAPEAPRAVEVLDLVARSGAGDLVAATVRAIGEGMRAAYHERLSLPPVAPSGELVSALASFAHGASSPVAIAAVDSLGRAHRAGATSAIEALAGALDHADEDVVKAALLKLAEIPTALPLLARGLEHPSPAVRILAVELLSEQGADEARERIARHLEIERDRRVEDAIRRALAPSSSGEGGG